MHGFFEALAIGASVVVVGLGWYVGAMFVHTPAELRMQDVLQLAGWTLACGLFLRARARTRTPRDHKPGDHVRPMGVRDV